MLCLALPFGLAAQPKDLGLIEALASTLERHPLLSVQEQNVQLFEGMRQEATGSFDMLLQWSASHSRTNFPLASIQQPDQAVSGIDIDNNVSGATSVSGNATKLFRNGIQAGPIVQLNRARDSLLTGLGINRSSVLFQVNLPLLRNRGRDVVAAQETAAGVGVEAELLTLNHRIAELGAATAIGYWTHLAAHRDLEVLAGSEERGRVFVQTVEDLIKGDRVPASERAQVSANLSDRVAARIAAEQEVVRTGQDLALAMGLPAEEMPLIVKLSDDFPAPPEAGPSELNTNQLKNFIQSALDSRADLAAAYRRVNVSEVLLTATQNQTKPQLDVTLSTGWAGLSEGATPWRVFHSPFSRVQGADAIASLTYSQTPARNAANGRIVQAQAGMRQSDLLALDLSRAIGASVAVALSNLRTSQLRLDSADESVHSFGSALQGERDKLRLGVGSLVDLLTVEDRLTDSLRNQVSARLQYALSIAQLRFASGTVVARDQTAQSIREEIFFLPPTQSVPPTEQQDAN